MKFIEIIKSIFNSILNYIQDALGLKRWEDIQEEVKERGEYALERCIDISKHQTEFNAAACKLTGVTTVICRLAYGSSEDKCLNAHAGGVITGGMKLGGYGFGTWHYSPNTYATARETMILQVSKWIELAKKYSCVSWIGIDQELETGNSMALSKEDNTELLCEAAKMIEDAGFSPCLYASASWIMAHVDLAKFKYPLWVAYYKWNYTDLNHDTVDETFPTNTGTYGKWMNQNKNRICIWQFNSAGFADMYGCKHGGNDVDKNWLYFQPGTKVIDTTVYFKKYTGDTVSIASALSNIGEDGSYEYRKKIAAVNNISNYSGTPEQNTHMLNMLKSGILIKP